MKKLLFLLLVLFVPMGVFAAGMSLTENPNNQELPTEGVTYFLHYPNDVEVVLEEYENDLYEREELIYEGTTDSNGEIILEDLPRDTKLRVLEYIPDGYSTNARELNVNLSEGSEVTFTNYKGLVNPSTGRNIIKYLLMLIFLVLTIALAIQNVKRTKQVLPILLIALLLIAATKVKAVATISNENLVINVKDDMGKAMSNVKVEVYAKPLNIEATPAIKLTAGGGKFLDETEEMYVKLPSSPSSGGEISNYYRNVDCEDENNKYKCYVNYNINFSYKLGYSNPSWLPKTIDDTYKNGDVVELSWDVNENNNSLKTVYPNGTYFDLFEKKLDKIVIANDIDIKETSVLIRSLLKNQNKYMTAIAEKYYIGIDDNPSCSNYQYGLKTGAISKNKTEYYVCWSNSIDGLYFELSNTTYSINVNDRHCINNDTFPSFSIRNDNIAIFSSGLSRGTDIFIDYMNNSYFSYHVSKEAYKIEKMKITYHGEILLDLSNENGTLVFNEEDGKNYLTNNNDKDVLNNYITNLANTCLS